MGSPVCNYVPGLFKRREAQQDEPYLRGRVKSAIVRLALQEVLGRYCTSVGDARELSSWKEIASALGVTIRTAQKWEAERGLPIRRLPGGRGRVAVDSATLELWKQSIPLCSTETVNRWPLRSGLDAEIRFVGTTVMPADWACLQKYLSLAREVLDNDGQGG